MTLECYRATFIFTRRKDGREGPSLSRVPSEEHETFACHSPSALLIVVRGSSLTSYPFDELIPSEAGTGLSNGGSFLSSGRVSLSLSLSLSWLGAPQIQSSSS